MKIHTRVSPSLKANKIKFGKGLHTFKKNTKKKKRNLCCLPKSVKFIIFSWMIRHVQEYFSSLSWYVEPSPVNLHFWLCSLKQESNYSTRLKPKFISIKHRFNCKGVPPYSLSISWIFCHSSFNTCHDSSIFSYLSCQTSTNKLSLKFRGHSPSISRLYVLFCDLNNTKFYIVSLCQWAKEI